MTELASGVVNPFVADMRLSRFAFAVSVLLLFVGCSTSNEMRPIPVAGGRVIGIPFGPQGPRPGQADGYTVKLANAVPGQQEREIFYQFAVNAPPEAVLQRVEVDDISEDQPSHLIDDGHPWITDHVWHMNSPPLKANDPRLAWIYTVTPTLRVYRFTLTDKSGRKTILHQVSGYPDFVKSMIRQKWGEKY